MFARVLLIATLSSYSFVRGEGYSTSFDNETYCLFSCGLNVFEAQKIYNFKRYDRSRYSGATHYENVTTQKQCEQECLLTSCKAYEWVDVIGIKEYGCWIHKTIRGLTMTNDSFGTLYVLDSFGNLCISDKTVKRPDICVGNVKENKCTTDIKIILACVIPLILLNSITFIVAMVLWRRNRERRNSTEEGCDKKSKKWKIITANTSEPVQRSSEGNQESQGTDRNATSYVENEHVYTGLRCPSD